MNEVREELFKQLLRVYRMEAFSQMSEFLQGDMAVMVYLAEYPQGVNPSELSDRLHLSRARVAQLLTALYKKKWVHMKRAELDRRKSIVRPTAIGLGAISHRRAAVEQYFDRIIAKLGEKRVKEMTAMVGEIVDKTEETVIEEVEK